MKDEIDLLTRIGCHLRKWIGDLHVLKRRGSVYIWPTFNIIQLYLLKNPRQAVIRFAWFEIHVFMTK